MEQIHPQNSIEPRRGKDTAPFHNAEVLQHHDTRTDGADHLYEQVQRCAFIYKNHPSKSTCLSADALVQPAILKRLAHILHSL